MGVAHRLALLCLLPFICHSAEWGYSGNIGPDYWDDINSACGGSAQSPIDVSADDAQIDTSLGEFTFSNYDNLLETWSIHNNGHTIMVVVDEQDGGQTLSGGGLPRTYKMAQFHWHWGSDDSHGSEHYINGDSYPMEVHIVHYDSFYPTIGDAARSGNPDALAVLGIMYQISDKENQVINKVLDLAQYISHDDESYAMPSFNMMDMLPTNTSHFARYSGSLTTPGCMQIVQWTVFKEPVHVTKQQMEELRTAFHTNADDGSRDKTMEYNFRPLMPLNGRMIKVTHDWGVVGGAAASGASVCAIVMVALLSLYQLL